MSYRLLPDVRSTVGTDHLDTGFGYPGGFSVNIKADTLFVTE